MKEGNKLCQTLNYWYKKQQILVCKLLVYEVKVFAISMSSFFIKYNG